MRDSRRIHLAYPIESRWGQPTEFISYCGTGQSVFMPRRQLHSVRLTTNLNEVDCRKCIGGMNFLLHMAAVRILQENARR